MIEKPLLSSGNQVILKVTNVPPEVKPIVRGIDGPVILILATILFTAFAAIGMIGATIYGGTHEEKIETEKIVGE